MCIWCIYSKFRHAYSAHFEGVASLPAKRWLRLSAYYN